tara:strand:+ start:1357 stop:1470 length:114 start_codon:yes stop_codon:yes gene_type:complete
MQKKVLTEQSIYFGDVSMPENQKDSLNFVQTITYEYI